MCACVCACVCARVCVGWHMCVGVSLCLWVMCWCEFVHVGGVLVACWCVCLVCVYEWFVGAGVCACVLIGVCVYPRVPHINIMSSNQPNLPLEQVGGGWSNFPSSKHVRASLPFRE